jgi:hypothetical protein
VGPQEAQELPLAAIRHLRGPIDRHSVGCWRGLMAAKGWRAPRQPDVLSDLAAGRALAELDHAASPWHGRTISRIRASAPAIVV